MKRIKDKIGLITGGASGIGRLMMLDLAKRGAKIVVWDIDPSALKNLANEVEQKLFYIMMFICDVTDREAVYRLAESIRTEIGTADVVSGKTLLETPDEKIINSINANTLSLFWTLKAFLPSILEQNEGYIVTIASAAGIIGNEFGLYEAIRMELRQRKSAVKTTIVCPFFIDAGMFSGVKTKFSFLLPTLKSEYTAKAIVKAVLRNQHRPSCRVSSTVSSSCVSSLRISWT
ncbi:MAG: SDR family oxidoreductase [Treponema sp.]|jgi:all-trans-retinol dehydrogenase (NAD+)|nr:SDR family oxidoreductase [Treponema sp.]